MTITTLCYIENDDKYLMLHRVKKQNDINKGKWTGVGGHAEDQESPEECLLREVKEETGLDVSNAQGGYLFTYKRENPGEGDNYFVDVYRFVMDISDEDLKLQTEETRNQTGSRYDTGSRANDQHGTKRCLLERR